MADTPAQNPEATDNADIAPDVPRASWIWIKDTAGYPSVSVTFLTIAFWMTTLWYLLSMVSKIGKFDIRPFDPMAAGAYLTPVIAMYYGRRSTEAKYRNALGSLQNAPK